MGARLLRLSLRQDGIALIVALGVMLTLTVAGTAAFTYTSSNSRNAQNSKAGEIAYSLAEAGIANSLSVLHAALDPRTGSLLPPREVPVPGVPGGKVAYSGVLDANYVWTITSTGKYVNPTGAGGGEVQRTLTRQVTVRGLMSGATVGAWSRIYHDNVSTCLTLDSINVPVPISSRGDLCLLNGASITGATTKVSVGDDVTLTGSSQSSQRNAGAGAGWTSSGNITSNNGSDASTSVAGGGSSPNLDASSFGFTIPSNATITGIRARVDRAASSSSRISDLDVYLLKAGAPSGNDKAAAGTWGTTDTYLTYGGSGDLWGTTWTPADVNASNFGLRLKVSANSGTSVTAYVDHVDVTVYYTVLPSIGTVATPVETVDVAGTCQLGTNPANSPCSAADSVFATTITTLPSDLTKPTVDMPYWYANAKPGPGPGNNCNVGSMPGGFDNDSTYNASRASFEATPTGSSYTCQWKDAANNIVGEFSWNHVTHVLKVKGTIFFDGSVRFDDDGQLINYQGRGILYAAGMVEFDEVLCAGGNGTSNCITNGMSNWDPTQNLLIILAGSDAEYDQDAPQNAAFQGIVYAKDDCEFDDGFHLSGPIICDAITFTLDEGAVWPTIYTWPPLGSLVEGAVYGSAATSPDFQLEVGAQSG